MLKPAPTHHSVSKHSSVMKIAYPVKEPINCVHSYLNTHTQGHAVICGVSILVTMVVVTTLATTLFPWAGCVTQPCLFIGEAKRA